MTIVRAPRPTSGYTLIRDSVLRDERLSYRARGVLAAILSRPDNWATSADKLALEGTEGRDAIRSAMDELAKYGYLERRNVQDLTTGRWGTQIIVYDQSYDDRRFAFLPTPENPSPVTGNPLPAPENPSSVDRAPTPEKPTSENQASIEQPIKNNQLLPSGELALTAPVDNSQKLVAEWIDHCPGGRPPGRVVGQVSKEVGLLLGEGIPYLEVRTGLQQWQAKGLHPSALASVVHEVRTASSRPTTNGKKLEPAEDERSKRLRTTPDPIPPADLTPAEQNRWLREARRRIANGERVS